MTKAHRKTRAGAEPSQRQLRVGEEIRHALAELFRQGRLRDPALAEVDITVTEVKVSPDLKNAIAFVLPFGGGDAEAFVVRRHGEHIDPAEEPGLIRSLHEAQPLAPAGHPAPGSGPRRGPPSPGCQGQGPGC